MPFEIAGKVALISGGASGIGLRYAIELLRNGLRGVTLADINDDFGKQALDEIQNEFGPNKAIYVKTNVTNKDSFEAAFKNTVEHYKNVDILVNNAGILNDNAWEKEVAVNFNGVVNGTLLGLEKYIPKHKFSSEGVIVNISSILGVNSSPVLPIYTATKHAVVGMSKAFGAQVHYDRTKVKVLTLCPGLTETPLVDGLTNHGFTPVYQDLMEEAFKRLPLQKPEVVAKALVQIVTEAPTGTVWVIEGGEKLYEFVVPHREKFAPK